MSTRLSGKLNITAVTKVTSPYQIEAVFTDSRGLYDETLISANNIIIDANNNRYKVISVINVSPLELEIIWDDLGTGYRHVAR